MLKFFTKFTPVKKVLTIFLLLIYSITNAGTTLNLHYCMGELMNINLFHSQIDKCPKCGMKKSNSSGCCRDEKKIVLSSFHNQAKLSNFESKIIFNVLPAPLFSYWEPTLYIKEIIFRKPEIHPPPIITSHRQHLLCCVFLI